MTVERWQRVASLFTDALARDSEERRRLLETVGDAGLRAEVETLLAAHDRSGLLDRLAGQMDALRCEALAGASSESAAGVGSEGAEDPSEILASGGRLGRYRIGGRLGAGGMGEVYRALDTRLQREVAIKILGRRARGRPGALERFEREARAASALNHPNIITVYDIGEDASLPYIVMELVDGDSLRRMLSGPWPVAMLLSVAVQIAEGLAAAHDRQIVHRDLKPENVLVTRHGIAKILDFGLAQFRLEPEDSRADSPQGSRALVGTLGYMSPELVTGGIIDMRSDQFSLGAILYEMATGLPACPGASPLEVLERTVRSDPRPVAELRPDAPAGFARAVARCLRKAPDDRYPTTRALLDDLRAERANLSRPARRDSGRRLAIPARRASLIGRRRELARIEELVREGGARLITLTGPAGTGKTRLAIEAAEIFEGRMPGAVFYAPLAPIADAALVAPAIARAIGGIGSAGRPPLPAAIAELRRINGRTLLVLDNFEQVIEAASAVGELLAACPDLTVLATSREVLRLYGEQAFLVPPLELPDPSRLPPVEELSDCPSVALFVERARAANPAFRLTVENASAVAALCARLDGLPLALELAAAQVRTLSPGALLVRLERGLEVLAGGARDLPGRQQTLRGAIDWSHQLLDPTEQAVFRRVAVFAGGFTLEAAQAAADPFAKLGASLEETLRALVSKSLLETGDVTEGEPRFRMLETLRDYALERLVESGEERAAREAHAAYFLVFAEGAAVPTPSTDQAEAAPLAELADEHDNLRAALDWLTREGRGEWALRLGVALFRFWERGEYLTEGRRRLDRALALEATREHPKLRVAAMFAAGVLASTQGDLEAGIALHAACLRESRELGHRSGVVVALVALGNEYVARGDPEKARGVLEETLRLWEELGDRAGFARSLSNLAFVARSQAKFQEARALYRRAAAMFELCGDPSSRAWAVNHEGDVAREQGDLDAADSLYASALEAFRSRSDRWGIGSCLADLGLVARQRGSLPASAGLYREALSNFVGLGHLRGVARLLEALAGLAGDEGLPEHGIRLAAAASVLRERLGSPAASRVRRELEEEVTAMRRTLGEDAARRLWDEAAAAPLEEAIRLAAGAESPRGQ